MRRIVILGLSLVLSAAVAVAQGRAGDFPSQPLRLIIGFPPGSAADITARLVGAVMSDRLGQQVVVESRPGAGSSIAAEFVARAPADGYTLYIGTSSKRDASRRSPRARPSARTPRRTFRPWPRRGCPISRPASGSVSWCPPARPAR